MRRITIAIVCLLIVAGCKKPKPYVCTCGIGTGNEETHLLDADFNPGERQAACEMFQTLDTNDQVITACEITE